MRSDHYIDRDIAGILDKNQQQGGGNYGDQEKKDNKKVSEKDEEVKEAHEEGREESRAGNESHSGTEKEIAQDHA